MKQRILIIDKIDKLLSDCRIGVIEVKNLTASDSQKVFNIINTGGEKLTPAEILSAKPKWNIKIKNPNESLNSHVKSLYNTIGTNSTDVVRWDIPATFIKRLNKNFVLKEFSNSKSDFEKELTYGFKILAGILQNGVKKEDLDLLSKNKNINWSTDIGNIINDINNMLKVIESFTYFKYYKSWKISIMNLTQEAIALNFILILYNDWKRKNGPIGNDTKTKQFKKNSFILMDKLIYEYVTKQWKGSSDSTIARNIENLKKEGDVFKPIERNKWIELLDEVYTSNSIDGKQIKLAEMKAILYHFYCLKNLSGPDTEYNIEVDHILPVSLFDNQTKYDIEIKDNILNLGLLPKNENISKSNRKLTTIDNEWLIDQIKKYEFIDKEEFSFYSDLNNLDDIFTSRIEIFKRAFMEKRDYILNN